MTTVEDLNRARKIYQLTRHGQAARSAIELYEQTLGRPDLRHHIAAHALRVEEEHVIDVLVSDLANEPGSAGRA